MFWNGTFRLEVDFPGFVGVTPAVGQTAQAHKLWSDVVVVAMLSLDSWSLDTRLMIWFTLG